MTAPGVAIIFPTALRVEEDDVEPWTPKPGLAGLLIAQSILVSLISRGLISRHEAHAILDENLAMLEDWGAHAGYGPEGNAQISAARSDLEFLMRMFQANPHLKLE